MTSDDKRNFLLLLQGVYEFYRARNDLSDFATRIWWNACQRYSFEQVTKAFDAHLVDPKSGQFLPKPADIVRALEGTHEDRSMLAWHRVHEAMSDVGSYSDVDFQDNAIHAAINDLGGWVKLCRTDIDELGYAQHRFCQSYQAYSARPNSIAIAFLRGDTSSAEDFSRVGLKKAAPLKIGNIGANTHGKLPNNVEKQ